MNLIEQGLILEKPIFMVYWVGIAWICFPRYVAPFAHPYTMSLGSYLSFTRMWYGIGWIVSHHSHQYSLWPGNCCRWNGEVYGLPLCKRYHISNMWKVHRLVYKYSIPLKSTPLSHNVALRQRKEKLNVWMYKRIFFNKTLQKTLSISFYSQTYFFLEFISFLIWLWRQIFLTFFSHNMVLWPFVRKRFKHSYWLA